MWFIYVVVGSVGSCYDVRVLRIFDFWENGFVRCGDVYIIGDVVYFFRNWLLIFYRYNGYLILI